MSGFDNAEVVEEKGNAAGLAKGARFEQVADFRRGPVAVIGQTFDNDWDFVRRKTFVGDQLKFDLFVGLTGAFLDRALDGVAIDRGLPRLFDRGGQARIRSGSGTAQFGRDHDFADQLDDHLALLLRVGFAPGLFPLCAHGERLEKLKL